MSHVTSQIFSDTVEKDMKLLFMKLFKKKCGKLIRHRGVLIYFSIFNLSLNVALQRIFERKKIERTTRSKGLQHQYNPFNIGRIKAVRGSEFSE